MKEHIRLIIGIPLILFALSQLSSFQKGKSKADAETERTNELNATAPIRIPFDPMIQEIQSQLKEFSGKEVSKARVPDGAGKPPYLVVVPNRAVFENSEVDALDPSLFASSEVWLEWTKWPDSYRAVAPANVKTLVFLVPIRVEKARYGEGSGRMKLGYRQDFSLWVFDWATKELIDTKFLEGEALPKEIEVNKFDFSHKPILGTPPNILQWLIERFGATR